MYENSAGKWFVLSNCRKKLNNIQFSDRKTLKNLYRANTMLAAIVIII